MRWSVFLLLVLFSGCVQEPPGTPEEMVIANITKEPVQVVDNITNVSEEAGEIIAEVEETNETAENETINETHVETVNETKEIEGIFFGGGRYVVILDDVVWYGDKSCAAVTIAYADGIPIKKDVMCPRTDYYWTDPGGNRFRFKVIQVAAGYSGEAWANIIIYG